MEKCIESFDGARIHYCDCDKGGKGTIFFLHGWAGNRTHWKNHFRYLKKEGYRVIAMDLRGYGKADESRKKSFYSFKNIARDVDEILKKEKIKKATLAGFSMGGMISLVFYSMFPKKVERLILASTAYRGPEKDEHKKGMLKIIHLCEKKSLPIFREGKDVDFVKNDFVVASLEVSAGAPFPTTVYLENIVKFNIKSILSKIKVPTLIIAGREDHITPIKFSDKMNLMIKNSEYDSFDSGHSFIIKSPVARKTIFEFLRKSAI